MNQANQDARQLMSAANTLGEAIDLIERLDRQGQVIEGEFFAVSKLLEAGPDVLEALRRIAMRLDRMAVVS